MRAPSQPGEEGRCVHCAGEREGQGGAGASEGVQGEKLGYERGEGGGGGGVGEGGRGGGGGGSR